MYWSNFLMQVQHSFEISFFKFSLETIDQVVKKSRDTVGSMGNEEDMILFFQVLQYLLKMLSYKNCLSEQDSTDQEEFVSKKWRWDVLH